MFEVHTLNVSIELWGVAFCIIGIASTLLFSRAQVNYRQLIIAGFALEMVAAGGDAIAGIFRGQSGGLAWVATHIGNAATFIGGFLLLGVITSYACVRIHEAGGSRYKTWDTIVRVGAIAMCVLTVLGAFYYIDDANIYHRSDWYWISMVFTVVVGLTNAVIISMNARKLHRTATACMLFYAIAPLVASIIQVAIYGPNFLVMASVISLIILFFEMQGHSANLLVEQKTALAQARAEATESRIAVMVSQIQPHFLFNTLDTIYGLCDEDAQLAKKAIASFSRYLRTNLNSLKRTTPVPIETEMEHVRTYLELERMSDEDRVEYEIDLAARGFAVPTLSIQTLVENAVKHGIGEREQGGHVTVSTRELEDEYTVSIVDDGVGFAPDEIDYDADHVGIENTRSRLAAMCGGSLDVQSEPGCGTTVTIHIPKEARGQ